MFSCACLRSSLARGTRLGRCLMTRRNFPDVRYKSKKRSVHLSSLLSASASLVLSTFDVCCRTGVLAHGGWAGLNAPDNSVWKSPQVMTHLVEQACWMVVALLKLSESFFSWLLICVEVINLVPFWTQGSAESRRSRQIFPSRPP